MRELATQYWQEYRLSYKCDVCGHIWISRDRETKYLPIACAKCKSPYWNKSERAKQ